MENRNDAPWRGWTRIRASGWFDDQLHSETYTLDLYDNYPVALIGNKRVLLDTGSQFSVGDGDRFEIAGQSFNFHDQMGVTTDKLSHWMNTQIDALLGSDVLSQFVVALDWWRSALTRHFCYRARVVASLKMLPKVKAPRRAK